MLRLFDTEAAMDDLNAKSLETMSRMNDVNALDPSFQIQSRTVFKFNRKGSIGIATYNWIGWDAYLLVWKETNLPSQKSIG